MSLNETPTHADAVAVDAQTAAVCHAHKFGGSSVATAAHYRHVARLLGDEVAPAQVAVVSAMRGATDCLIGLAQAAADGRDWQDAWAALADRHLAAGDRHHRQRGQGGPRRSRRPASPMGQSALR